MSQCLPFLSNIWSQVPRRVIIMAALLTALLATKDVKKNH